MTKQKSDAVVPLRKEYSLGSITVADVIDVLGDHVGNQMTDELMQQLAEALGSYAIDYTWLWAAALEDDVDLGEAESILTDG